VLDWNAIMLATTQGQPPFHQARFGAITQLAVFEAVNAITGDYDPCLGTIGAPPGASPEAAAVAAAHRALRNYFPAAAPTLDAARTASLAAIPDGPSKDDGIAVGETAAAAMIALRADDGSAPPQFHTPPSSAPWEWQLTPSCTPAGGIFLHWRDVTPFGISSSQQFRAAPPPGLTSHQYAQDHNELRKVGGVASTHRPPDRADVARFCAVVLPPVMWNQIAAQLAAARRTSLSELTSVRIPFSLFSLMVPETLPARLRRPRADERTAG
jgi:hypothetical protein